MLRSLLKFSLLCSILLIAFSNTSEAQVRAGQSATEVICTSGCSGGTTDIDDGTVAGAQTTGINISLLQLWDGSNWKRATGTAAGGLNVICTSGCGSPPASADNTAFVAGTTNVSNAGFVFNNSITALTSGSYGAARVSANRAQLHINWDAAGNERGANVNANNQLSVSCDNGCAATSSTFGAAFPATGSAIGFTDGTNFTAARVIDGDTGAGTDFILKTNLVKRANGGSTEIGITGAPLVVDLPSSTLTTVTSITNAVTVAQPTASSLNAQVVGNIASGSADSGNPVKIGGVFNTTQPTVTNGQRVDSQYSARGGLIISSGVDTINTAVTGSVTANAGTNLNTSLLVLDSTITGRLPAGTTPANGESNAITTSRLGSYNFIYNGATWDRWTGAVTQSGTWNVGTLTGITNVVHIDDNSGSLTVDGTVTTTPPANASTNITQFGSVNLSTGTGASGTGIPRVTISNDSSLAANQSVNVSQINGVTTQMGVGASGTGTQRVITATDSTIGTVSLNSDVRQTTASNFNATVVGNIASGSADSGNPLKVGGIYNSTQPTFTDGQRGNVQISPRGALYVTNGVESLSVICTSGCTPGGSFADNATFTLNTSAVNNTGYLFNDSSNSLITTGNAGIARMSGFRIPYSDLSEDTSNLLAYLSITSRADAAALGGKANGDKVGYYLRSGIAGAIVTQQNPLPVTLPDSPDPCSKRKGNVAISQTATTKLISGKPGQLIAICYSRVVNATAEIINELEGTGTNCGTSTLAISGSTTAANGESFAANGGFSAGVGMGTVSTTNIPGNDYCLGQSGAARVSGHVTYVYYQP